MVLKLSPAQPQAWTACDISQKQAPLSQALQAHPQIQLLELQKLRQQHAFECPVPEAVHPQDVQAELGDGLRQSMLQHLLCSVHPSTAQTHSRGQQHRADVLRHARAAVLPKDAVPVGPAGFEVQRSGKQAPRRDSCATMQLNRCPESPRRPLQHRATQHRQLKAHESRAPAAELQPFQDGALHDREHRLGEAAPFQPQVQPPQAGDGEHGGHREPETAQGQGRELGAQPVELLSAGCSILQVAVVLDVQPLQRRHSCGRPCVTCSVFRSVEREAARLEPGLWAKTCCPLADLPQLQQGETASPCGHVGKSAH